MTKAQHRVFAALEAWRGPYAPTLEALTAAAGLKSISTVSVHVRRLIHQGLVRRVEGGGLVVVPAGTPSVCPTCHQPWPLEASHV